jgi:hypothetical protein
MLLPSRTEMDSESHRDRAANCCAKLDNADAQRKALPFFWHKALSTARDDPHCSRPQ